MTKDDLRIVFLGTPEFAAYSLNKICDAGYNVVGVVTMPDKVGAAAIRLFIRLLKLPRSNADFTSCSPKS